MIQEMMSTFPYISNLPPFLFFFFAFFSNKTRVPSHCVSCLRLSRSQVFCASNPKAYHPEGASTRGGGHAWHPGLSDWQCFASFALGNTTTFAQASECLMQVVRWNIGWLEFAWIFFKSNKIEMLQVIQSCFKCRVI